MATGDFTHPSWYEELRKKLVESSGNLFTYQNVSYVLGTEVSCVYQQSGRLRRVHLLLYAPPFDAVSRISTALSKWGNLSDDGRPTFTISCGFVQKVLYLSPEGFYERTNHPLVPLVSLDGRNRSSSPWLNKP